MFFRVVEYLRSNDVEVLIDASAFLQHLSYNNDHIKEDIREYGEFERCTPKIERRRSFADAIPLLVRLLRHQNSEIVRNCAATLKNLAYGPTTDVNKRAIAAADGIQSLALTLKTTRSIHVLEESTASLNNLSACDELKTPVFQQSASVVVEYVVVPGSGIRAAASGILTAMNAGGSRGNTAAVLRNAIGIIRNVSAASAEARRALRVAPNLVEALIYVLHSAIAQRSVDSRLVENVVCVLRNLSYRQVDSFWPTNDNFVFSEYKK